MPSTLNGIYKQYMYYINFRVDREPFWIRGPQSTLVDDAQSKVDCPCKYGFNFNFDVDP